MTITVIDGGVNTYQSQRNVYNRTCKMAPGILDYELHKHVAADPALLAALLGLPVFAKAAVVAQWETDRRVSQSEAYMDQMAQEWLGESGDGDEGAG